MTVTFPATVVLTGTITDASGQPVSGTVTAVPVALYGTQAKPVTVTDASGLIVVAPSGVRRRFDASSGGSFSMRLAATDTAGLAPANWAYQFTLDAGGQGTAETFTALLPGSPSAQDFSGLIPTTPGSPSTTYLPQTGGTLSGTLTLGGSPPLRVTTGAAAGDILTSDSSGNATWKQPPAFSPMAFGAAGNGTTDDTTPVLAAFTAASAVAGTVDLGHYRFLMSAPIPAYSGMTVQGDAWYGGQAATGGGTIINNSTDLFLFTANSTNHQNFTDITFRDCWLYSGPGGGHIWNAGGKVHTGVSWSSGSSTITDPSASAADIGTYAGGNGIWTNALITGAVGGVSYTVAGTATNNGSNLALTVGSCNLSRVRMLGVNATQNNSGKAVFYQAGGDYIGCMADAWCVFTGPSGATISPWYQYGVDIATITFDRMTANGNGATAVPFFTIDFGAFNGVMDMISFRDIVFEVCTGGCTYVAACTHITLENLAAWDAPTSTGNIYQFGTSANGYSCENITVRHSRNAGTNGSGFFDVKASSGCTGILLDTLGTYGTPATWSTPVAQTTVINCGVTGTQTLTAPVLSSPTLLDPLRLGYAATFDMNTVISALAVPASNDAVYMRFKAGGYTISNLVVFVNNSSGNISVATYTGAGSGLAAAPTGGQTAASGAIACPAGGNATVSLGSSVSPGLTDWAGLSADNTSATFYMSSGINTLLASGLGGFQATAHPLPGTPGISYGTQRFVAIRGS